MAIQAGNSFKKQQPKNAHAKSLNSHIINLDILRGYFFSPFICITILCFNEKIFVVHHWIKCTQTDTQIQLNSKTVSKTREKKANDVNK